MTKTTTLAAMVLAALAGSRALLACSCGGPNPVCSAYWQTDTLLLGHVTRIEHIYDQPVQDRIVEGKHLTTIGPGQYLVHFDVTKVYRGIRTEQVVIRTADQGPACGYSFKEGRDYLVYAYSSSGQASAGGLSTNHCTRTHEVTSPDEDADLKWLEGLAKAPAGSSIFGQIRMLRQNPDGGYDSSGLEHIAVTIKGPDSKTITSDAAGKFQADGLAPGKYLVSASAPGGYQQFPDRTVTLQDRGCGEVVWSTRLDGHIRGHVYFADGTPAAGLYLAAKSSNAVANQPWTWNSSYATTGPDGAFDFTPLAPGSYVFGVNVDFSQQDGKPYYRKAFFPGTAKRLEAASIAVGAGQIVDRVNFVLPPDSPPPSIHLPVLVIGYDGQPLADAQIMAHDSMWENSPTPLVTTTDRNGQASLLLRPGSHYDISAYINRPDATQACAEPQEKDASGDEPVEPIVLRISHPFGNCMQFKKKPDLK